MQICEAFSANRYPFPEDPARQRQMNAEVTARLRELQTTIEAGAHCWGRHAEVAVGFVQRVIIVAPPNIKHTKTGSMGLPARVAEPGKDLSSQLGICSPELIITMPCRRAAPRQRPAGHRGHAGGLDRAGQAREGRLPHPQQVQVWCCTYMVHELKIHKSNSRLQVQSDHLISSL